MAEFVPAMIVGLTFAFMLVGLVGLLVPIFPGIGVIWFSALLFGILQNQMTTALGWGMLALITVLGLIGSLADNVLMGAAVRKEGAPWSSIFLGALAGFAGTFLLPPLGGLVAAPAVLLLLEYRRLNDWPAAWQTVRSLMFGWGISFVVRFGFGVLMVIAWGFWALNA